MTSSPRLTRYPHGDEARPPGNPFRRLASRPAVGTDECPAGSWYRIAAPVALVAAPAPAGEDLDAPAESSRADVYLFDVIGGWFGTYAEDLVNDVVSLDVDELHVHLNSPGGDVAEGVAIGNVLRQHRARVVMHVDGLAASAASVIAMAGDEIVMGAGSQLMVHDAWTVAIGNAAELEQAARMLDSTSTAIASTYAARAGGTVQQWRAVMRDEQWYTADEAVEAGLADRVATDEDHGTAGNDPIRPGSMSGGGWSMWDSLRDPDRFDLSAYVYAGRQNAPRPAMPGRETPAASAAGHTEQEGTAVAFSDEQLATMRQSLGLADDADENTIVGAMTEALNERAEDAPAAAAAPTLPEGVVTIDAGQLEQLHAAAQRGEQAFARQEQDRRAGLVQAALDDGRIAPARRQHWLDALTADEVGTAATLAALAPGLVPVGAPIGHDAPSGQTDPAAGDSYWFRGVPGPSSR